MADRGRRLGGMLTGALDVTVSAWAIARREMVGLLRTRKAFLIAVLTVGAASVVPLFAWPGLGASMTFNKALVAFLAYTNAISIALFLFVPAVSAASITVERERDTYALLHGTPIRPSGIVLGKLIASTGFFAVLVALTFPMAVLLHLLGGFEARDFLALGANTLGSILFMGTVGMWCSMRSQRTFQALVRTYVTLFALSIILSIAQGILLSVFMSSRMGPRGFSMALPMLFQAGIHALVALLFLLRTLRRSRLPDLSLSPRAERKAMVETRLRAGPRPIARTWITRRLLEPSRDGIPDSWNPVLVAAVRSEAAGTARTRRMIFWGVGGLLVVITLLAGMFDLSQSHAFWDFQLGLSGVLVLLAISIVVPGVAAASLSSERALGNLDFLRSTILTPFQVFRGKLGACLFAGSGLLALCVLIAFVHAPFHPMDRSCSWAPRALSLLPIAAAILVGATATGLLAGALVQSTTGAVVMAYALWVGGVLILPAVILSFLFRHGPGLMHLPSPFYAYVRIITDGEPEAACWVYLRDSVSISLGLSLLELLLASALYRVRWLREA